MRDLTVFESWQQLTPSGGYQGISSRAVVEGIDFEVKITSEDGRYWRPLMIVSGAPCGTTHHMRQFGDIEYATQACEKRAKSIILEAKLAPIEANWTMEKTRQSIDRFVGSQ